jgi:hypothetical protein
MTKEDALKIINRHIARILTELEDDGCPVLIFDNVKSRLGWLRSDIVEAIDGADKSDV